MGKLPVWIKDFLEWVGLGSFRRIFIRDRERSFMRVSSYYGYPRFRVAIVFPVLPKTAL